MKRLLVLSFFPAFTPPSSGGESRLYNLYLHLSRDFHVTLISSSFVGGELQTATHAANFVELRVPKDATFERIWAKWASRELRGDLSGPCFAECSRYGSLFHRVYLDQYDSADIIIHESPFSAPYDFFLGLDRKPRVYNSYNCETSLYAAIHTADADDIRLAVRNCEDILLREADLLAYCSAADLSAFVNQGFTLPANHFPVPNGVNLSPYCERLPLTRVKNVVFLGSFHQPNVEAANFIVSSLAPACPSIHFHVIGGCLETGIYPPNVSRYGNVDAASKASILSKMDVAINPVITGGGSSLKVLEFISAGLPLVSTSFGVRGFAFQHGVHVVIAERDEFITALTDLCQDYQKLKNIAHDAYHLTKQLYCWSVIAAEYRRHLSLVNCPDRRVALILNDYDPINCVGGGGNRIRGLHESGVSGILNVYLSLVNSDEIEVTRLSSGSRLICIPKTTEHLDFETNLCNQSWISVADIVNLYFAGRNELLKSVFAGLKSFVSNIFCEHVYLSPLIRDYPGLHFVYSSHNVEAQLKKDLLKTHPSRDWLVALVEEAEKFCVACSVATLAVSDADASSFMEQAGSAPVYIVPNGSAPSFPFGGDASEWASRNIGLINAVFIGSSHIPNLEAARFLLEFVVAACPSITFHFVGSVCSAIDSVNSDNVRVHGVLDEEKKSALLSRCQIGLNPVVTGGGTNIKNADYLAHGLLIVGTHFAKRGYSTCSEDLFLEVKSLTDFPTAIRLLIDSGRLFDRNTANARQKFFEDNFSWQKISARLHNCILLNRPTRKRILAVSYRATSPPLGGAEKHFKELIRGLAATFRFEIDFISTDVGAIHDKSRFLCDYSTASEFGNSINLQGVRFRRFGLSSSPLTLQKLTSRAWHAQALFERRCYEQLLSHRLPTGIAWGFGEPEPYENVICRWAYSSCGIHSDGPGHFSIKGIARFAISISVFDSSYGQLFQTSIDGDFILEFQSHGGVIEIVSTCFHEAVNDPRNLAFFVRSVNVDGVALDLSSPLVWKNHLDAQAATFDVFLVAQTLSRDVMGCELGVLRGPFSESMEEFLRHNIMEYDLVISHNTIFYPATCAISEAAKHSIPSIVIPHVHLDDDFYYFDDVHRVARMATAVLCAPTAACEFYQRLGISNVVHHTPGCDVRREFASADEIDFSRVYKHSERFFLILGRKVESKGYREVISRFKSIAVKFNIRLVLIGPDIDGLPVLETYVSCLGLQPENIVRGALSKCIGLVNMSLSESFGMVILEAWLAGKPCIANLNCAAFTDLVRHGENGFLSSFESLTFFLEQLVTDRVLCARLGAEGARCALEHSWENVNAKFLVLCESLMDS